MIKMKAILRVFALFAIFNDILRGISRGILNALSAIFKNKKASIALVIMLITLGIILIVGLVVVGNLKTVADNLDLGTQGNSTRTSLFNNIYSAFDLAVIIPIVAAAGAIIGVVFAYFKGRT